MSSAQDIFEDEGKKFELRLTEKERVDYKSTTLQDVKRTITQIQQMQQSTKTLMDSSRLRSFIEAMEQFDQVIGVFANTSIYVGLVYGPIKFLLLAARNFTESYDALMDAYKDIGESLPQLDAFRELFSSDRQMQYYLAWIYVDILKFHREARLMFQGQNWQKLFKAFWKDFNSRFKGILQDLQRHKHQISVQAGLRHYADSIRHVQQYQLDIQTLWAKLDLQEEQRRRDNFLRVIDWLAVPRGAVARREGTNAEQATEQDEDHDKKCQLREANPGSGDWIMETEKMKNWIAGDDVPSSSIMWLTGIPGAGKTVLASRVIEECKRTDGFITSYFYCKEGDPRKNNCLAILKGLLSHMIRQFRSLIPYCFDKAHADGQRELSSSQTARSLLEVFCERISHQFIIIDGLDECDVKERTPLLSSLKAIVDRCDSQNPGKLRLLIISQDFNDIKGSLTSPDSEPTIFRLTEADNRAEIEGYVAQRVKLMAPTFNLSDEEITCIRDNTCLRANGMFLFAELVMENLSKQARRVDLLDELKSDNFPDGLRAAYERIVCRMVRQLSPSQWKQAQKLLGWIVCAKRPLMWHEIQCAVSINPIYQVIDIRSMGLSHSAQDLCGSLIIEFPGGRLELVHNTARRYVTQTPYVQVPVVECKLACLCLQYLTFSCFRKEVESQELEECVYNGYLAFQDYAASKWFQHLNALALEFDASCFNGSEHEEALLEIGEAMEDFLSLHEEGILAEGNPDKVREDCRKLIHLTFHDNMVSILAHVTSNLEKGIDARNEVCPKTLGEALVRNREVTERLASRSDLSPEQSSNLTKYYGNRIFKCPKVTCPHFFEGFFDAKSRDGHFNGHRRPWTCEQPNCTYADFGFVSDRDLKRHIRDFHPEKYDWSAVFVIPPKKTPATKNQCTICGKKFSRKFHRDNHINAHNGERPHSCSECGKSFTRANDCKRHEKTVHARRLR